MKHCCRDMEHHAELTCPDHPDPADCGDIVVRKYPESYGIPVHDGGSSYITINYCPWCGQCLEEGEDW